MAVISSLPGVQAEIRINGERAEEYVKSEKSDESDTDATTTTRYIEARSGATFTIHCALTRICDFQGQDISVNVIIDGVGITSYILLHEECEESGGKIIFEGDNTVQEGQFQAAPFSFSELSIDEQCTTDSITEIQERIKSLGEICIKLERGQAKLSRERSESPASLKAYETVPEKAIKGGSLSHHTTFQESRPTEPWDTYSFSPGSEEVGPFATFIFRYRSRVALQAEGIIPRTPSPTPLEDRPLEELSPEELRELVRRQKEQISAASSVKSEIKSEIKPEENAGASRSKRAHDPCDLEILETRRVQRLRTSESATVIIDLSDD